ncbi:hypothetical protein BLA29_014054, partial [Euroglyphus maynei]
GGLSQTIGDLGLLVNDLLRGVTDLLGELLNLDLINTDLLKDVANAGSNLLNNLGGILDNTVDSLSSMIRNIFSYE